MCKRSSPIVTCLGSLGTTTTNKVNVRFCLTTQGAKASRTTVTIAVNITMTLCRCEIWLESPGDINQSNPTKIELNFDQILSEIILTTSKHVG